eukprot:365552-Chlamydomonas_euryale.AAC.2
MPSTPTSIQRFHACERRLHDALRSGGAAAVKADSRAAQRRQWLARDEDGEASVQCLAEGACHVPTHRGPARPRMLAITLAKLLLLRMMGTRPMSGHALRSSLIHAPLFLFARLKLSCRNTATRRSSPGPRAGCVGHGSVNAAYDQCAPKPESRVDPGAPPVNRPPQRRLLTVDGLPDLVNFDVWVVRLHVLLVHKREAEEAVGDVKDRRRHCIQAEVGLELPLVKVVTALAHLRAPGHPKAAKAVPLSKGATFGRCHCRKATAVRERKRGREGSAGWGGGGVCVCCSHTLGGRQLQNKESGKWGGRGQVHKAKGVGQGIECMKPMALRRGWSA